MLTTHQTHKQTQTQSTLPGWLICQMYKENNQLNIKHHSQQLIDQAQELAIQVQSVYFRSKVYINFYPTMISVKVDKPQKLDVISIQAGSLERQISTKHNIKTKKQNGNLIFNLTK